MKKAAPYCVICAAILWGIIGIFTRKLNEFGFDSVQIVTARSVFTAIIMGGFILIKDKSLFKIRIKDIWMFLGSGIVSVTFFNICYFTAINLVELSTASILLYTAPSFVMIFSVLIFKEKLAAKNVTAFFIAFAGCIMVTGIGSSSLKLTGILMGLLAGIGYALYSIFARIALNRYNSYTITLYTFVVASLGLLPVCKLGQTISLIKNNNLWYFLLLSVLCTVLPYIFYTEGLKYISPTKASIIAFAEPVTATFVGILFFKEHMTFKILFGMIMILISIVIMSGKEKHFTNLLD